MMNRQILKIKVATLKGYRELEVPGVFNFCFPHCLNKRGRVIDRGGVSPTLTCTSNNLAYVMRIDLRKPLSEGCGLRKFTPRECYRLMGVSDCDIDRLLSSDVSKTQHYKLAGNSIVVDVLYHVFRKMFVDPDYEEQQRTLM